MDLRNNTRLTGLVRGVFSCRLAAQSVRNHPGIHASGHAPFARLVRPLNVVASRQRHACRTETTPIDLDTLPDVVP